VINRVLSILDFVPPRQHEKRAILEELAELLQDKRWNLVSDAARERIKLEELRRMAKAKPFRLEDLPVEVRRGFRGPGFGEVWLTMVWHRVDLSDLRQAAQLKEVVGRFDGASFVNLRNVVPKDVDLLVDVDGERAELRCPGGRQGCVEEVIASLQQLRLKGKPVFRHVLPVREAVRKKIAVAGGLRGQVLAVAQPWVVLRATRGPRAVQPSGVFNVSSGEIVLAEVVELLLSEGRVAFAVAFAAIFIAALLDFRSLRLTLLAVLPLVVGFLWTFGVSAFIGLKLNLFNFVILPALFGIGIDYGVHYVHRYTSEGPGSLGRVMRSLYWVIFFCACTSIIGFGNMALAAHPGLRSLGQLSIVGLACIFFASTYTLPAVLYVVEVLRGKQPVPAPDTGEIVVYAVSYCPVCRLVRRLLTDSGVRYTYVELDTLPTEQRQEIAARLGELASAEIPVTRVGERFVSGFAPEELRQAIATLDHDTGDR
jgi:glutaredoxin